MVNKYYIKEINIGIYGFTDLIKKKYKNPSSDLTE